MSEKIFKVQDLKDKINKDIDEWLSQVKGYEVEISEEVGRTPTEESKRELPKGKRVVRTKTSGDRVYLLDDEKKIRQWITNPEVLKSTGFELSDVTEVEDSELLRYQMGPALYRVEQNAQS